MFVKFLQFFFSMFCWKEVINAQPTFEKGELCFPSLRVDYLHKLFGILPHGSFVSSLPFTYLFSHLSLFIFITHGHLFYTLGCFQYYFILLLKLFQLKSLGALSVCSSVRLTYPQSLCFLFCFALKAFFTFWHYKIL